MGFSIPDREDVIIGSVLARNAREMPDEVFVTFEDGSTWTRQGALNQVRAAANVLRDAGVQQGDTVAMFMSNGPEFLRAEWAVAMLGAVSMPINTAYRGNMLARQFKVGSPQLLIADEELASRIDEIEDGASFTRLSPGDLLGVNTTALELDRPVELWDTQFLIMTSGTTGPSKLARVSFLQTYVGGAALLVDGNFDSSDVFLVDLPLFHMSAQYFSTVSLSTRTRLAVRTRPALSRYWEVARESGATSAVLLSSMVPYVLAQEPRPAEREHGLRLLMVTPLPADVSAFKERFSVDQLMVQYGSTEVPACLSGMDQPQFGLGYSGRVRPPFEVRLADDNDMEVLDGLPGEALVRSAVPWSVTDGYVEDAESTAKAWRNGWFHTGDILRKDFDGNFFFVDRSKDALRRRGEMVSAQEVETCILGFPSVLEAACVAHSCDSGVDDEIKAWIVPKAGAVLDFEEVMRYCVAALPHFMVPRYFEAIDELPKTPSAKIQKYQLRDRGDGPLLWDALDHGLRVTRNGIEQIPTARLANEGSTFDTAGVSQ